MQTKNTHTKTLQKSLLKTPRKYISIMGFTLVELIVVITILVILGTIAFLQLGGFAGSARDGSRITGLTNLKTGLDMFQIKSGAYPMPDGAVNITASGETNIIGYQGFAKDQIGSIAKFSPGGTLDPLDTSIYTTYSVNQSQSKMQLMTFLEDGSNVTAFVPNALTQKLLTSNTLISEASANSTSDYSKRYPKTLGDTLGILLSTASGTINQPVQESGSGVDILNTTGSYTMYFDGDTKITGTGTALKAGIGGGGLVGYWSFDEGSGTIAYDRSGKGNNGTLSGTNLPTWTGGKIGGSLNFSGGYVGMGDVLDMGNASFSISVWFYVNTSYNPFSKLVSKGLTTAGTPQNVGYSLRMLDATNCNMIENCIAIDVLSDPALNFYPKYFLGINNISLSYWHNATYVLNRNTQKMGLYINGSLKGVTSISGLGNVDTNIPLAVGALYRGVYGGTTEYFNGLIDEVRIYNRALSESEIQSLYNAAK